MQDGKPVLIDLFCGAGGCTKGYQRAGFYVIGVDLSPQPRYCGDEFIQADALTFDMSRADAVHASPPCQFGSVTQVLRANDHPNLIPPTRERLRAAGVPYVIENVCGARAWLVEPIELCGTMFELPLYRHRLFESSVPLTAPLHGGHYLRSARMGRRPGPNELHVPVGNFPDPKGAGEAMGIDWMSRAELAQAIPPAYTELIGHQLMAHVRVPAV